MYYTLLWTIKLFNAILSSLSLLNLLLSSKIRKLQKGIFWLFRTLGISEAATAQKRLLNDEWSCTQMTEDIKVSLISHFFHNLLRNALKTKEEVRTGTKKWFIGIKKLRLINKNIFYKHFINIHVSEATAVLLNKNMLSTYEMHEHIFMNEMN